MKNQEPQGGLGLLGGKGNTFLGKAASGESLSVLYLFDLALGNFAGGKLPAPDFGGDSHNQVASVDCRTKSTGLGIRLSLNIGSSFLFHDIGQIVKLSSHVKESDVSNLIEIFPNAGSGIITW